MADILGVFMHAERIQESGNNYHAFNRGSGAGGAYQFEPPTWRSALIGAGFGFTIYMHMGAQDAPPAIQDAAARFLMGSYYREFHNWGDVAEAWYGGPGAVGHPGRGGGPGFPNVGQYAAEVLAIFNSLLIAGDIGGGGGVAPPPVTNEWSSALKLWEWVQVVYGKSLPFDSRNETAASKF